jgi:hypothetical protein
LTGPIAALKRPTCYSSASLSLLDIFLFGFSSELSERIMSLSTGMLNCFNEASWSSLLG